jgi:hypothetical protein
MQLIAEPFVTPSHHPYVSFTEGFDTADLKDAKALLDQLK